MLWFLVLKGLLFRQTALSADWLSYCYICRQVLFSSTIQQSNVPMRADNRQCCVVHTSHVTRLSPHTPAPPAPPVSVLCRPVTRVLIAGQHQLSSFRNIMYTHTVVTVSNIERYFHHQKIVIIYRYIHEFLNPVYFWSCLNYPCFIRWFLQCQLWCEGVSTSSKQTRINIYYCLLEIDQIIQFLHFSPVYLSNSVWSLSWVRKDAQLIVKSAPEFSFC